MDSRTTATTSLRRRAALHTREYQTAGRIGCRRMSLRSPVLVSSSARLTLGGCVVTVDNGARRFSALHSARAHPRFDERRNCLHNEVSSYRAARTLPLASRGCHSSHPHLSSAPHLQRPSNVGLSHSPLGAQHRPPVYPRWPSGA